MLKRPVFAPRFRIGLEEGRLLLSSETAYSVLEGSLCYELAQHLNGDKTTEEIVADLSTEYPAEEVYYALMLLEKDGYLVDKDEARSPQIFLQTLGIETGPTSMLNKFGSVAVETIGLSIGVQFASMLEAMELQVDARSDRRVVLASDYLHPELEAVYERALEQNYRYLLIKPFGASIWVGPSIIPGFPGCWFCLKHRLELNRPSDVYLAEQGGSYFSEPELHLPHPVMQLGLNLAALETAKWIGLEASQANSSVITHIDLTALESTKHTLVARPQCPACGNPSTIPQQSVVCREGIWAKKAFYFRTRPAEETLTEFQHHVSPITGVVRSLSRVSSIPGDVTHNYTAGHSARLQGHSIESLRLQTRDQSGGKGKSDTLAKTSALCESLERFSAVFDDDPSERMASFTALDMALHPDDLLLFSPSQYARRAAWNANQHGNFQLVPDPFDEEMELAWTQVWSLTAGEPRYVPSAYCYYGYTGPGSKYCRADSNGLAAGNCLEEAIVHGVLELAERDAVAIWWYNRLPQPAINLSSIDDPYVASTLAFHASLNREVWVLDVTNDLEIPTFVAVSRQLGAKAEDILLGFGAHVDAPTAVLRSLLEVNQSLPTVRRPRSERQRQLLPDFKDALTWWDCATIENQPYLLPALGSRQRDIEAYPSFDAIELASWIDRFVSNMADFGMETLVLDLTRLDIGLSVARVIVPGLRHFWRRLGKGRLYDVPVKLGISESPLEEQNMNPISLFL